MSQEPQFDKRHEDDALTTLLTHIEDTISDEEWEKLDAALWNAVTSRFAASHALGKCGYCGKPYSEPSAAPDACRDDHSAPSHARQNDAAQLALDQQSDDPAPGDWNAACRHIADLIRNASAASTTLRSGERITPAELEHLIEWHDACAKFSVQSDNFVGETAHTARATALRKVDELLCDVGARSAPSATPCNAESPWQQWRPIKPPNGVHVEVKLDDGQVKEACYTLGDQLSVRGWYQPGKIGSLGGVVAWRYMRSSDGGNDHG